MPQGVPSTFLPGAESYIEETDSPGLPNQSRVVAGFVGILGEVMDWDLILGVARILEDVDFRFYGPRLEGTIPDSLPGNVHLMGSLSPAEVPHVVRSFDVGLIPYVRNERTDAVLPTKLAEYLASGVRVASTSLPDVVALSEELKGGEIEVADDVAGFAARLLDLARRGRIPAAAVGEFCARHSWDRLVTDFVAHLEEARSRPSGATP